MGFAPHDQNELTEQLIELATNDSLRKNVAEAGQAHIQTNFSPRAFGEGLRDAINRVPQHHRPERDIQH